MHLRGEPIGLSIGGFVVIDKSLVLSVCENDIAYLFLCPKTFNPLRCMHIYFLSTDSLSLVANTWLLMISPDVLTILGTFSFKLLDKLNFVTKNRISNLELLWFWFTTPSDCFGKLFSPSQPIG